MEGANQFARTSYAGFAILRRSRICGMQQTQQSGCASVCACSFSRKRSQHFCDLKGVERGEGTGVVRLEVKINDASKPGLCAKVPAWCACAWLTSDGVDGINARSRLRYLSLTKERAGKTFPSVPSGFQIPPGQCIRPNSLSVRSIPHEVPRYLPTLPR